MDPYFARHWAGAAEAGLVRGAYHFFSFDSEADAQARNLFGALDGAMAGAGTGAEAHMLPVAIDVELYGAHKGTPPDARAVRAELARLLDAVEARYGRKPAIYATMESYRRYIDGAFEGYPLWIRDVYVVPELWGAGRWAFWQYSDRGRLDGYVGRERFIDLNAFRGTMEELEGMWGGI